MKRLKKFVTLFLGLNDPAIRDGWKGLFKIVVFFIAMVVVSTSVGMVACYPGPYPDKETAFMFGLFVLIIAITVGKVLFHIGEYTWKKWKESGYE